MVGSTWIPRKRYLAFAYLFLGLSLAFPRFSIMKDMQNKGLSMPQISKISAILYSPWTIKWAFGFITDRYPVYRGLHRRPYSFIYNVMSALISFTFLFDTRINTYLVTIFCLQLFATFSDVVLDGMMMDESINEKNVGDVQTFAMQARYAGNALSGIISGSMYQFIGRHSIFITLGCIYVVQSYLVSSTTEVDEDREEPVVFEIEEEGVQKKESVGGGSVRMREKLGLCEQCSLVFKNLRNPLVGPVLLLIFISRVFPQGDIPMFYFMVDDLGFSPTMLGVMEFVGEVAKLAALEVFRRRGREWGLQTTFIWSSLAMGFIAIIPVLMAVHVPSTFQGYFGLALVGEILSEFVGKLAIQGLVLCTTLRIPREINATMYSVTLAVENVSGLLSMTLQAGLMHVYSVDHRDFVNLSSLLIVCSSFNFVAMLMFWLLPEKGLDALKER